MSLIDPNSPTLGLDGFSEITLNASMTSANPPGSSYDKRVFQVTAKPLGYVIGEQLRNLFDFVYSKLPSLSLPGAQACSIEPGAANHCVLPTGSYLNSCQHPTVTYLPNEGLCVLDAQCSTIFAALPLKDNRLKFNPRDALVLGNQNGTLTVLCESEYASVSPEEANAKLDRTFEEILRIDQQLIVLSPEAFERKHLEETKRELLKSQNEVIGKLKTGSIITLDDNQHPIVITPENKEGYQGHHCSEAFTSFHRLASSTGGIMGLSRSSDYLPLVVEKLFNHILYTMQPGELLDIAFVLDTTASMRDDYRSGAKEPPDFP